MKLHLGLLVVRAFSRIRRDDGIRGTSRGSSRDLSYAAHPFEVGCLFVEAFNKSFGSFPLSFDEATGQTAVLASKLLDRSLLLS